MKEKIYWTPNQLSRTQHNNYCYYAQTFLRPVMGWHWFEVYLPDTKTLKTPWGKKGNVFSHKCRYITPREWGNQCQQNSSQIFVNAVHKVQSPWCMREQVPRQQQNSCNADGRRTLTSHFLVAKRANPTWPVEAEGKWDTDTKSPRESNLAVGCRGQQCRHTRTKQKAQS